MSNLTILHCLFLTLCLSLAGLVKGQECQVIELPGEKIHAFTHYDQKGFLWISSKQGWYRCDGNNYKLYTTPVRADTTEYWQNVQSFLFTDRRGRKWYTTYSGLHYYEPDKDIVKNVPLTSLGNGEFTDLQIVYQHPRTDDLLITVGKDIYRFSTKTQVFSKYGLETTAKRFAFDTFPNGEISTVIGCIGLKIDGLEILYRHSPQSDWMKQRITDLSPTLTTPVNNAIVTANGQAYLATKSGLISFSWKNPSTRNKFSWKASPVFDGGNTFSPVLNPAKNEMAFTSIFTGIGTVPIKSNGLADFTKLSIDSSRKFYLGVNYHGNDQLWGWNKELGLAKITLPLKDAPKPEKIISPLTSTFTTVPDRSYLVSHESGEKLRILNQHVVVLNGSEVYWQDSIPTAFKKYSNGEVDYLKYLGENVLLAAIKSSSISVFEWTESTLIESGIVHVGTDINCISKGSRNKELWIGTPKGLYRSVGPTALPILGKIQGLGNLDITAILLWQDDWLILGSNNGIIFYETTTKKTIWAGWCNDLLARPVTIDQLSLNSDSRLVRFQSGTKIIEFDPTGIPLSATPLEPYISNYSINDIPVGKELLLRNDSIIKVKATQNTLGFQLSSLGFDHTKGATVNAELIGYDLLPISYAMGDIVRKSGLSSGTYNLRLTAYNGRGEQGLSRTLTIIVIAPLWQRPEFLTLIGFLLMGLTYLFFHLRTRRQLREAATQLQRQQALAAERDRIAAELHDDLGGDLASMAFIIDGHNSLKELGVEAELDVSRLGQLANDAIKNMREMIWVLDDEQATLPILAKQLLAIAREMAAIGDLSLQADIPETLPELSLSSIQKKNILLIAKEAMQNIRKHAKASAFNLRLAVEEKDQQQVIVLTITDNGRGMPATQRDAGEKQLNHGHGLKNLHKRAAEIKAELTFSPALPRGTKVELRAPIVQNTKTLSQ